jgi:DNA-binding Xre family transcriptional regulator
MQIDRWKVRQLMALRHIDSDAELARRLGVERSTVSRWFAGKQFTPANLGKLCEILDCTPNDVLTPTVDVKATAPAGAQI